MKFRLNAVLYVARRLTQGFVIPPSLPEGGNGRHPAGLSAPNIGDRSRACFDGGKCLGHVRLLDRSAFMPDRGGSRGPEGVGIRLLRRVAGNQTTASPWLWGDRGVGEGTGARGSRPPSGLDGLGGARSNEDKIIVHIRDPLIPSRSFVIAPPLHHPGGLVSSCWHPAAAAAYPSCREKAAASALCRDRLRCRSWTWLSLRPPWSP